MVPFIIGVDGRTIVLTIMRKTYAEVILHDGTKAYVDYLLSQQVDPENRPPGLSDPIVKDLFRSARALGMLHDHKTTPDKMNPPKGIYTPGTTVCTIHIARAYEVESFLKTAKGLGERWFVVEGS